MNTICGETELGRIAPAERFATFVKRHWDAFQEQRKRERLRAYGLNDQKLKDIGISRGEIDDLALKSYLDPRGDRSPGWTHDVHTGWIAEIGHDQTHHF